MHACDLTGMRHYLLSHAFEAMELLVHQTEHELRV
jgi:hypothetical protein